jgi:hypothetical protein
MRKPFILLMTTVLTLTASHAAAKGQEITAWSRSSITAVFRPHTLASRQLHADLTLQTVRGDVIRAFIYTEHNELNGTYELQEDSVSVYVSHDGQDVKHATAVLKLKPISRKREMLTYKLDMLVEGDTSVEDGFRYEGSSLITVKAACEHEEHSSSKTMTKLDIETQECADLLRLSNFR